MNAKNPLYVVKGKTVMEAKGLFDLVLKKFNLEPLFEILMNIVKMLLAQVNNYTGLVMVKTLIDEVMAKFTRLVTKMGLA